MASAYKINAAGLRIPVLSSDPSSPENGLIWYNSTSNEFKKYENGSTSVLSSAEADGITYDNATSGLTATDVQAAIDEVEGRVDTAESDLSTAQSDITDAESDIADLRTTQGTADGDTNLGTFTGSIISDNGSVKAGMQELETEVELKADSSVVTEIDGNVDDLITLSGVAENSSDLGTFTGATISDSQTVKAALQDLETALEEVDANADDLITLSGVAENSSDLGTFTGSTITDSSSIKSALQELETEVELKAADADVVKVDGSAAFTADQSMGNNKLTNLAEPTADSDAATKAYVDAIKQGLDIKDSVRAASTANVDLSVSGSGTLDGVTLSDGDRILLKDQTTGSENGIYDAVTAADATTWVRSADADEDSEVTAGLFVFVEEGSTHADAGFVLTTDDPITVDTTALSFTQFSGAGAIAAGDGLSKSGSTLSVNVDSSTIEIVTDTLQVADGGITDAKVASGIDAAKLHDGSVSNTEFGYLDGVTSAIQTQLDAKLENVVEDTTPQLGGTLDLNSQVIDHGADALKVGSSASNFYETEYVHSVTLSANTTAVVSDFTFAHASFEGAVIEYKMKQASTGRVRVGQLYVATDGTNASIADSLAETGDAEITWDAAVNGANLEISYTNADGSNDVTMRSVVKRIVV